MFFVHAIEGNGQQHCGVTNILLCCAEESKSYMQIDDIFFFLGELSLQVNFN